MLPENLVFSVTITHLMVKMNLLQHIIYFVVKLGPLIQTPFCGSKQLPNFMLPGKLIFSVIQTHLMVKRELLQQIIYFVEKLGHLIQTFLVAQNQCFKNRTRLVQSVTFLVQFPLLG